MDTQRIEENMTQHTPGPWKVREWAEIKPSKKSWGLCIYNDKPDLESRLIAHVKSDEVFNARLIASAPELLELVKVAFDRFTDNDMMPPNHALAVWLEQARAALAKAEGVRE